MTEKELRELGVFDWYHRVHGYITGEKRSKLTYDERDAINKKLKIGKYREWTFDDKRFNEIVEECFNKHSKKMMKAGVNYYRKHYEDAKFLTDQQILDQGLYKQMYRDCQTRAKDKRNKEKEEVTELDLDLQEFM